MNQPLFSRKIMFAVLWINQHGWTRLASHNETIKVYHSGMASLDRCKDVHNNVSIVDKKEPLF